MNQTPRATSLRRSQPSNNCLFDLLTLAEVTPEVETVTPSLTPETPEMEFEEDDGR